MIGQLPDHVSNLDPEIYRHGRELVLDFETTNLDYGSPYNPDNRIVLACWLYCGKMNSVRAGEFEQEQLIADCEDADFIVAHNAKFELGWLRRCGLDIYNTVVYDTMLGEYVLGGNKYQMHHLGLQTISKRRGGSGKMDTVSKMIKGGVPTEDIPARWLDEYCQLDVELTADLFKVQVGELSVKHKLPVAYMRNLVVPVLVDMEARGMQLDEDVVVDTADLCEHDYIAAEAELEEFCAGVSPGSPVQMAPYVYGTELGQLGFKVPLDRYKRPIQTATGRNSVAADTIKLLKPTNARQRTFIRLYEEYTRLKSEHTKYLKKFRDCVIENGGRLHASFNQTTTRTHRFSSSGTKYRVQFQNLSRAFKPLFTARRGGWLIGEADGSQLEFRVAAHMGRDKQALADIRDGVDVHAYTAKVLSDSGQRTNRQDAKEHTFKPLYGGSSGSTAERAYYAAFKSRYTGIADTQDAWCRGVCKTKSLVTEWGLEYFWPDTRVSESGYIINSTSICNYPVQALATAEIIPLALVCFWHRLRGSGLDMYLVNTVHDSIIAEIPPEEEQKFHELSEQCLITDVYELLPKLYGIDLTVPLGAGVKCSRNWGDGGEETVYQAGPEMYERAAKEAGML